MRPPPPLPLILLTLLSLLSLLSLLPPSSPSPPTPPWLSALSSVSLNTQPLLSSSALSSVLTSWEYSLPESALRKGTGYIGSNHRLRRAVRDAVARRRIKIGVIGGSITFGDKASTKGSTDWVSLLGAWAQAAFVNVTTSNGAMPGTPSSYMAMCLEHSLDPDVDIVFSEYCLNDGFEDRIFNNGKQAGYEKLLRRVLGMERKPAVVMMQMFRHGGAADPSSPDWQPFHSTLEDVYGALAQYYDVQYLSFRSATYRLNQKQVPHLTYADLMEPLAARNHPVDAGHKVMADLAVWLIQQTALDLMLRPWDHADVEQMQEALPPPMIPGNEAPSSIMCVQGYSFQKVVSSAQGWTFTNEGTEAKPKTGYVAHTPGSVLTLELNTLRPGSEGNVVLSIGHLRSYEHMGMALLSCASGCHCQERQLDAHHDTKDSQNYLAALEVSQHPQCKFSVTVLNATSSGEHKFKVTSVTVSETANPPRLPHLRDGYFMEAAMFHSRNKDPEGFGQWLRMGAPLPPSA